MRSYKTKNYTPRRIGEGDWVVILATQEKGYVEKLLDGGERLLIRVPSLTNWPWPRWIHVDAEKVRLSSAPKVPKEPTPDPDSHGESPF